MPLGQDPGNQKVKLLTGRLHVPLEVPMLMGAAYPSAALEGVWVRSWAPYSPQDVSELSHAVCRQAAGTLVTLARLAEEEHADRSLVEGCPMPFTPVATVVMLL